MVESVRNAVQALEPLRLDLAQTLAGATDRRSARKRIAEVKRRHKTSSAIGDALFVPAIMAELAGQLMVYAHELTKPLQRHAFADDLGAAQDAAAFLNKPWVEAIADFRARGIMSDDELSILLDDYAQQAAESRQLLLDRVQHRVYELLTDALTEGHTFPEFAQQLREDAPGLGITTENTSYLQNVFRTNILGAYGAGRLRAQNDPDVVEARPYRQIRTSGDARVRDEHDKVDGMVFRSDHPTLGQLKPPFGFQCRCAIVSLEEWDGDMIDELPDGTLTPGFG